MMGPTNDGAEITTVKSNYRGISTLIYGGYKRNNKVYLQEK